MMRNVFSILFFCMSTLLMAQVSRGDQLYAEGLKLQKTQTIVSQKSAIKAFQSAKIAYTTSEKKAQCDTQIGICNKTIKRLNGKKPEPAPAPVVVEEKEKKDSVEEKPVEVQLSLSESRLDFKYKPKENQTVKVNCNREDWEITSSPEWLKVYTAANEFSVIADENKGDDRSGVLIVRCGDKEVLLVINQAKKKRFIF